MYIYIFSCICIKFICIHTNFICKHTKFICVRIKHFYISKVYMNSNVYRVYMYIYIHIYISIHTYLYIHTDIHTQSLYIRTYINVHLNLKVVLTMGTCELCAAQDPKIMCINLNHSFYYTKLSRTSCVFLNSGSSSCH